MNGVLSYHLAKLEGSHLIIAGRRPRTSRFYSARVPESDHSTTGALRRPAPRAPLIALLNEDPKNEDGLSFSELVEKAKGSRPTVSLYLAQLAKEDLVDVRQVGLKKYYRLRDRKRVERLLEDRGPSLLGKYASNFEETINPPGRF